MGRTWRELKEIVKGGKAFHKLSRGPMLHWERRGRENRTVLSRDIAWLRGGTLF